jgi:hypothetical protein
VVEGFAVDEDVAGGGTFEAAEDVEQGGFAGAGSTAEKDFFSGIHFEVHAAQYVEVMAAQLVAPMDILGVKRVGVGWGHEAAGWAGDNGSEDWEVQRTSGVRGARKGWESKNLKINFKSFDC